MMLAASSGILKGLPHPYEFKARGPDGTGVGHSMFLVHEILHNERKGQSSNALVLYGDDVRNTKVGRLIQEWCAHPDANCDCPTDVTPIGVHGDAMQYTSTMRAGDAKSVIAFSFNIIVPKPKVRARRYMLSIIRKESMCNCGCEGYHTIQDVNEVLSWSMQLLRPKGVAPRAGHRTQVLDLKHRLTPGTVLPIGALLQVRGDWNWCSQAYRFRRPNEDYLCWLCHIRLS